MTLYTRENFINNAALIISNKVPLTSYEDARTSVETVVNNIGWVPDEITDTFGIGHLANNKTDQVIAQEIIDSKINDIKTIDATINLNIKMKYILSVDSNQTEAAQREHISSYINSYLTNVLENNTTADLVNIQTIIGPLDTSGYTTATERLAIYGKLSDTNSDDPMVIALQYVKNNYTNYDSKYNVSLIYTDNSKHLAIKIQKYTDLTFSTLDNSSTDLYLITVSRETFKLKTGIYIT